MKVTDLDFLMIQLETYLLVNLKVNDLMVLAALYKLGKAYSTPEAVIEVIVDRWNQRAMKTYRKKTAS